MCRYQWARRWRPLGTGWDGGHLPAGLSGNLTLFPFKTHGVLFNNGSNFALGKGKRSLFRPQLCEGKERKRKGRKRGWVSLSRVRGLLSAAPLPRWACVCPSPQWKPRRKLESYCPGVPGCQACSQPGEPSPCFMAGSGKGAPGVLSTAAGLHPVALRRKLGLSRLV